MKRMHIHTSTVHTFTTHTSHTHHSHLTHTPFTPPHTPPTHSTGSLASKNLPAAIEDTSGDELPESIREKAEAVQEQGGIGAIEEKFFNLPDLLQTNREILDEVGVSV